MLACSSTSGSLFYTPITGVVVRGDALTAETGCGREPGEVLRYLARIEDSCGRILFARDYDCFADATFVNLPPSASGSYVYTVRIYAFDESSYASNFEAIQSAVTPVPVGDGGSELLRDRFAAISARYVAACSAAQSTDVQSLAVCQPLHAPGAADADLPPVGCTGVPPVVDASAPDASVPEDAGGTDSGAADSGLVDSGTDAGSDAAP